MRISTNKIMLLQRTKSKNKESFLYGTIHTDDIFKNLQTFSLPIDPKAIYVEMLKVVKIDGDKAYCHLYNYNSYQKKSYLNRVIIKKDGYGDLSYKIGSCEELNAENILQAPFTFINFVAKKLKLGKLTSTFKGWIKNINYTRVDKLDGKTLAYKTEYDMSDFKNPQKISFKRKVVTGKLYKALFSEDDFTCIKVNAPNNKGEWLWI